jgi:hypothetical protein
MVEENCGVRGLGLFFILMLNFSCILFCFHRQRSILLGRGWRSVLKAMVQWAVQGAPTAYAKEMERLSAKESLLLAVSSIFILFFKFHDFIFELIYCSNVLPYFVIVSSCPSS